MFALWGAVFLLVAAVLYIKFTSGRKYRYPPGPRGLPVLGNVFQGSIDSPHIFFSKLRRKYGDIITVNMAGRTMIILNSASTIKEFFASSENSSVFAGRPVMFLGKYVDGGKAITCMDYSDVMLNVRKVIHKSLHMYGEGVESMEKASLAELQHVVEWVASQEDNPFNFMDVLEPSAINNMTTLILGKRSEYGDATHRSVSEYNTKMIKVVSVGVSSVLMKFPFLRHIPYSYGKTYQLGMEALRNLVYHMYEKPKQSYDPNVTRGLLDVLLKTQDEQRLAGNQWLDDDMVKMNIKDLLVAAMFGFHTVRCVTNRDGREIRCNQQIAIKDLVEEIIGPVPHMDLRAFIASCSVTTRGALMSFFLIILYKPEVARHIQSEIDKVIGQRNPSIKDRSSMPYTEATIWELLRYISHAPLAVPHRTTRDVAMREYFVPVNTIVVPNLWEVHHDEALWDEPWEFKPERFIENGQFVDAMNEKRKNVMAFSAGKRSCAGETFARSRLFLYITILLQRFDFRPTEGATLPSHDPRDFVAGIVLQPAPYTVQATLRNN